MQDMHDSLYDVPKHQAVNECTMSPARTEHHADMSEAVCAYRLQVMQVQGHCKLAFPAHAAANYSFLPARQLLCERLLQAQWLVQ